MFEIDSGELRATFLGNHTGDASCTRRPTQQHEGRCTRYGPLHPLRGTTPDQKGCNAYGSGAAHPITRTNAESARRSPTRTRPRELALPGPQLSSSSANAPRGAVAAVRDGDAGGGQAIAQLVGARPVLGGGAAARSDSTARTSASNAECSAAAAPDAPAPMPAWPRGLGNTLTGTARQRARARR